MDQITFHYDTVLSDVHMLLPNARHLMTHLNHVGQPVFITKFKILSDPERNDDSESKKDGEKDRNVFQGKDGEEGGNGNLEPFLDEDGDLNITHRYGKTHTLLMYDFNPFTEHTMATPLEDVGKQVWRGAFLLADFILSEPVMFRGATVLELGAGTGLTSIVMATVAKTVYCTDVGDDLLSMSKRNVTLNRHMMEPAGGEVRVRQLDWLKNDLCTDADVDFSWTEEEVADIYDNTSFIIAADVCYDDDLTDGLFRTLYRLCSNFTHTCTIFISLEKRMNFTLRHMDISCEAYDHFSQCLSQIQDLVDGRCSFSVEKLPCNFAQFFLYERIEHLELWKVTATPLPSVQIRSDAELRPS
uniref:Methyltransferase like 22 n=1 Tax=Anabas testudineus TaxID=64144 RepID=A0A7N5ZY25_ANATE